MIIDGKKIAQDIYADLARKVKRLPRPPGLGIVLVGKDPGSVTFCRIKAQRCKELGFYFKLAHLSRNSKEEKVIAAIKTLNRSEKINGIIVQLPLPKKFSTLKILSYIKREKDVEGLNPLYFFLDEANRKRHPVGASAVIMEIIKRYKIPLKGKHVVIVNDSYLIGKPLAHTFLNRGATVTMCHKFSPIKTFTRQADILITATGKPHLITAPMVKKGSVVLDMGFSVRNGKVVGDVDFDKVKSKCQYITPNPGGIGPITVAMLLLSTYKLCLPENQRFRMPIL